MGNYLKLLKGDMERRELGYIGQEGGYAADIENRTLPT
jgi:hypothetical protein